MKKNWNGRCERARERKILIPTFKEQIHPETIPEKDERQVSKTSGSGR